MKAVILFFLFFILSANLLAHKYSCIIAAKKYEEKYNIPDGLLLSMSLTESGKKINGGEFISWPWTINRKGKGKFFKNKMIAINYVKNYVNNGKKNIDIGCMQVNHMYHPNAFSNFYEAFDPDKNVEWAANTLISLYSKFGSWKDAVGYYHSYRKSKRKKYSAKVFNTLETLKNKNNFNFIQLSENHKHNEERIKLKKKQESLSLVRAKINSQIKQNSINTSNDYISARMEKVNFFRNYFYNKKIN